MWTSSHEANAPSEDRHASLVNLLLMPKDEEMPRQSPLSSTSQSDSEKDTYPLIRVSMWCVLDGHGGGCVASYASEVLLPHIAASIAEALNCTVVSQGVFRVNGEQRHLENIDLSNLLQNSTDDIDRLNPFAIHYTAPEREDNDIVYYSCPQGQSLSDDEDDEDISDAEYNSDEKSVSSASSCSSTSSSEVSSKCDEDDFDDEVRFSPVRKPSLSGEDAPATTRVTEDLGGSDVAAKRLRNHDAAGLTGTHSPVEVATVSEAITHSFLSVDEGWMNSIDASKVQSSCVAGGRWNSGACALVVCIIQRLKCSIGASAEVDAGQVDHERSEAELTSDSSLCPFEDSSYFGRKRTRGVCSSGKKKPSAVPNVVHAYEAMLYTAHCGDCRAVLGTLAGTSATSQPMNIVCQELEYSSESDRDDDSKAMDSDESDGEEFGKFGYSYLDSNPRPSMLSSMMGIKSRIGMNGGYKSKAAEKHKSSPSFGGLIVPSPLKSVELTVDHSAYNPVEIEHVLRRCNNAPRAIATATSGGINRVAGSLAVTRALGDAYLKVPLLSFSPYKHHAPYISAQPEVSSRIIAKDGESGAVLDKYIVLASDGIWERAEGEDVLRWIQSYFHDKKIKCSPERRLLPLRFRRSQHILSPSNVSDHVLNRLLRAIRKARNLPSLGALVSLPRGRGRRSKHDDMTASVVDISGFVL